MSTIFTDVIKLDQPIFSHNGSNYYPEDSQFERLLKKDKIRIEDCEKCHYAIRIMNAGGCTFLDPFISLEQACSWIADHIDNPGVWLDGQLSDPEIKTQLEENIGRKISDNKHYKKKNRERSTLFEKSH